MILWIIILFTGFFIIATSLFLLMILDNIQLTISGMLLGAIIIIISCCMIMIFEQFPNSHYLSDYNKENLEIFVLENYTENYSYNYTKQKIKDIDDYNRELKLWKKLVMFENFIPINPNELYKSNWNYIEYFKNTDEEY